MILIEELKILYFGAVEFSGQTNIFFVSFLFIGFLMKKTGNRQKVCEILFVKGSLCGYYGELFE